jgi:hypothetical protein
VRRAECNEAPALCATADAIRRALYAMLHAVEHCVQRTGLCAGWEIEFRLPVTKVDDCNIADVLFIAKIITSCWN